jgi:hypothetical protein
MQAAKTLSQKTVSAAELKQVAGGGGPVPAADRCQAQTSPWYRQDHTLNCFAGGFP